MFVFPVTFQQAGNTPNSEFQQNKFCPLRENMKKITYF